ncbi:hypothetical protein RHGRI_016119 [Rhododendron griersonianum]|uniref:1-acylglycerol-3-phosphate O-acyltransferase n=1 Tax=Rhododendron griersonianum TaxID=479676 RepID=A0AAV6JT14_9ERIC|nr:hypothetical protein RHGRI_016119 [Rhododendron griersonianum]
MERVVLIANHRTEVDWMYMWDLALRKGCLGYIKFVLKSSLMKLPIFGWGFHILEFIPVERKWEIDEPILRQMLSTFANPLDPLWLAVFPEGTDFTEQKCKRNQKFAAENGLPVLKNVLLPKTKGFCTCLEILRGSLDAGCYSVFNVETKQFEVNGIHGNENINKPLAVTSRVISAMVTWERCGVEFPVGNLIKLYAGISYEKGLGSIYDITIAYKHRCPSFVDNLCGVDPSEVHIHVQRIPIKEMPLSESEAATWLINAFQHKDELLSQFVAEGHFPQQGIEEELSTFKGLVNFSVVVALTGIFVFLTFCSSIWFKIYIGFACAYLSFATYLNFRPLPVLGIGKPMLCN